MYIRRCLRTLYEGCITYTDSMQSAAATILCYWLLGGLPLFACSLFLTEASPFDACTFRVEKAPSPLACADQEMNTRVIVDSACPG